MSVCQIVHSDITWGDRPLNEGWVDRRFAIFKDYVIGNFKLRRGCPDTKWVLKIHCDFKYCIDKFSSLSDVVDIHILNPEEHSLAPKKILEHCTKYDWIYYTRCDTDDLLGISSCERIMACKPALKKAILMQNGFNYNIHSGGFGIWGKRWQPNSTIVFPTEIFLDKQKSVEYGVIKHIGLKYLIDEYDYVGNDLYCILLHGDNTSTTPSGSKHIRRVHHDLFKEQFPVLKENFETLVEKKNG